MSEIDEIRTTLDRLGRMLSDRNPGFADEFDETALLIGSEPGERAEGREAIRALFDGLAARPGRRSWDWQSVDIAVEGPIAWVFADGSFVLFTAERRTTLPYRMSGVLSRKGNHWRWRLFHGSEPKVYEADP